MLGKQQGLSTLIWCGRCKSMNNQWRTVFCHNMSRWTRLFRATYRKYNMCMQWLSNGAFQQYVRKLVLIPCGCCCFLCTTPWHRQLLAFTKLAQPRFGEFCAFIYLSSYPQYHILLPPDYLIMPAMSPQRIFLLKTESTVPLENLQRLIETLWLSSCFISRPVALCWLLLNTTPATIMKCENMEAVSIKVWNE